ncbi:glycosyltransferase [Methylobacterium fujisawaense]|uniref:glycosyltransferase family 4 protein n=1 Tax=Methylobacterium fujisawaense TaxID=107400 RepID=UPI002F35615D
MMLRLGWVTPFNDRTGVGTFSKAVTDALPDTHEGRKLDVTIVTQIAAGLYDSRHRIVDIQSTEPTSRFYEIFDVIVYNIGNNEEHHGRIFDVLRNFPGIVICHDYVYQHVLAKMAQDSGSEFADYVALAARYGSADGLRRLRESNITRIRGLRYAIWDSDLSADMPLGAPLFQLGSALVVHSQYAETYARAHFEGPILRLGMPHDQRPAIIDSTLDRPVGRRRKVVSFGHVQSQKCIHDVLLAIAGSPRLRNGIVYVISGFSSDQAYLDRLRALVDENALKDCVRFALNLSDVELAELSDQADAFINLRFPNTEGASVSLIEQLGTGKPVVVFDTGCYSEVPDDAVIKVKSARDIDAIGRAMLSLLEDQETLEMIGVQGRAYAKRIDCRSYTAELLDFLVREESVLRRRSRAYAFTPLEAGNNDRFEGTYDVSWSEALATARATLNRLEQGTLAEDPTLIAGLEPEAIADFVQAARLRRGTDGRLNSALRVFFADRRDTVRRSRILHAVNAASESRDEEAAAILPEIVPHRDLAFWDVIAALGDETLSFVIAGAYFGTHRLDLTGDTSAHLGTFPIPSDDCKDLTMATPLRRMRLADALERSDRRSLKVPFDDLAVLIVWLRQTLCFETDVLLDPLLVGQTIDIGMPDQNRFLELAGFYEVQADHVWSKPKTSLLYLAPDTVARQIILSGSTLSSSTQVEVTALTRSGRYRAEELRGDCSLVFEIEVPSLHDLSDGGILCIAIHSTECVSPMELNLSKDVRPLGFQLKHLAVR